MTREQMKKGLHVFIAEIGEDYDAGVFDRVVVREYVVTKCGEIQYELTPVKGGMTQGGWWRNSAVYRKAFLDQYDAVTWLRISIKQAMVEAEEHITRLRGETAIKLDLIARWQDAKP